MGSSRPQPRPAVQRATAEDSTARRRVQVVFSAASRWANLDPPAITDPSGRAILVSPRNSQWFFVGMGDLLGSTDGATIFQRTPLEQEGNYYALDMDPYHNATLVPGDQRAYR